MVKEIVLVKEVSEVSIRLGVEKEKTCSCCGLSPVCRKGEVTIPRNQTTLQLKPGDKVEVEIEPRQMLVASLLIFGLPILIFVATLLFFHTRGEWQSFTYGILALCGYYILLKLVFRFYPLHADIAILRKVG